MGNIKKILEALETESDQLGIFGHLLHLYDATLWEQLISIISKKQRMETVLTRDPHLTDMLKLSFELRESPLRRLDAGAKIVALGSLRNSPERKLSQLEIFEVLSTAHDPKLAENFDFQKPVVPTNPKLKKIWDLATAMADQSWSAQQILGAGWRLVQGEEVHVENRQANSIIAVDAQSPTGIGVSWRVIGAAAAALLLSVFGWRYSEASKQAEKEKREQGYAQEYADLKGHHELAQRVCGEAMEKFGAAVKAKKKIATVAPIQDALNTFDNCLGTVYNLGLSVDLYNHHRRMNNKKNPFDHTPEITFASSLDSFVPSDSKGKLYFNYMLAHTNASRYANLIPGEKGCYGEVEDTFSYLESLQKELKNVGVLSQQISRLLIYRPTVSSMTGAHATLWKSEIERAKAICERRKKGYEEERQKELTREWRTTYAY